MNFRRSVAVLLICATFTTACSRPSRPDEKRAKVELQRVFDRMNYGIWRVDQIRRTNGRMTTYDGMRAYVMDADVDLTVIRAIRREETLLRGVKMLIDVWSGDTWLLDMLGRAGERKMVPLQLLWIEKDQGWELIGPCSNCP